MQDLVREWNISSLTMGQFPNFVIIKILVADNSAVMSVSHLPSTSLNEIAPAYFSKSWLTHNIALQSLASWTRSGLTWANWFFSPQNLELEFLCLLEGEKIHS